MTEAASTSPTPSEQIAMLIDRLHAANERFTQARQHLERMMVSNEYDHYRDRDAAESELRTASAELEQISAKIHETLGPLQTGVNGTSGGQ